MQLSDPTDTAPKTPRSPSALVNRQPSSAKEHSDVRKALFEAEAGVEIMPGTVQKTPLANILDRVVESAETEPNGRRAARQNRNQLANTDIDARSSW